jgi:hypothetical protein
MIARISALEERLMELLVVLKKNKENVPLETLKTTYAESYSDLTEDIRSTLTDYVKAIVCSGLPVSASDVDQAAALIDATVEKSNYMKHISSAAFKDYDLNQVYNLAVGLRVLVIQALLTTIEQYTYLDLNADSKKVYPFPYNTVLKCFQVDDAWVMLDTE